MKDQFIPYEYANIMKELGYKEECYGFYALNHIRNERIILDNIKSNNEGNVVSAPLYQQAEEWLWDKHGIYIKVLNSSEGKIFKHIIYKDKNDITDISCEFYSPITTHREAILKAIAHLNTNKV